MAETALSSASAVYSLGPLIHNPQTLASLRERGLVIIDEDGADAAFQENAPASGGIVIIRAHGISPATEEKLRNSGVRIMDATCPRVKASQNTARMLAEQGCCVFIAGEKKHAEVKGIAGYAEAGGRSRAERRGVSCIIAGNAEEAAAAGETLYRENPGARTALIAQTTLSVDEYAAVADALTKRFPGLEVQNTICGATQERQDALRELCAGVDMVVVAGGRESANTRRLLAIAGQCGKPCLLAETAADLPAGLGGQPGVAAIGLCAGASTPDHVIDEMERALSCV